MRARLVPAPAAADIGAGRGSLSYEELLQMIPRPSPRPRVSRQQGRPFPLLARVNLWKHSELYPLEGPISGKMRPRLL
jgi:hypothetical protein